MMDRKMVFVIPLLMILALTVVRSIRAASRAA